MDECSGFGDLELHYSSPAGLYLMTPAQERGPSSHARILAASWLLSAGVGSPTEAAGVSPASPEPVSIASSEGLARREQEVEVRQRRGFVPTRVPREPLYSIPVSIRTAELPEWKPRVTGDYGRASREDD